MVTKKTQFRDHLHMFGEHIFAFVTKLKVFTMFYASFDSLKQRLIEIYNPFLLQKLFNSFKF